MKLENAKEITEDVKADIEDFRQLRESLGPLLSSEKKKLLQRIQGMLGAAYTPAPRNTKRQRELQLMQAINEYL